MNKQKIIPYRLLNNDTEDQVANLMVTSRKETKIRIKSKIKGKSLISKSSEKDEFFQSNPSTSQGKRPTTQSSARLKFSNYSNSELSSEQLFNILKSSTISSSKSSENLTRLKSLNWGKRSAEKNLSVSKNSPLSNLVDSPMMNVEVLPRVYAFRPLLLPFIQEMKPRIEEAEKIYKINSSDDLKVTWVIKDTYGDKPNTREGSQLIAFNNKLYLFGGQSRIKHTDLRELDLVNWSWRIINTSYTPQGRLGHSLVLYKTKIILYGGESQHSSNLGIRRCSHKVYYLSLKHNKWQHWSCEGEKPESRRHHAAAKLGKFMLIYGGMNQRGHILSDLYLYDIKLKKWILPEISIQKDPGPRSHSSLTGIFDNSQKESYEDNIFSIQKQKTPIEFLNCGFYLFGGLVADDVLTNDLHGLYLRDGKFVWTLIQDFTGTPPSPRYNHTACSVRARLFIFGGRNDLLYKEKGDSSLDDLFCFNIATLKWENLKISGNLPIGRWGHCMASAGSRVLMLGGLTNKNFMTADLYVLETEKEVLTFSSPDLIKSPKTGVLSFFERKKNQWNSLIF